jgi:hypothetical protein
MPAKGSVLRLLFPMSRTDYSPLPLPCFTQDRLGLHRSFGSRLPATTPAADFCRPISADRSMLSPRLSAWTGRQISRGKFDRFQHTTGGSTCAALMDQHFVAEGLLVPAARGLISASCSSARAFAPRFLRTRLTAAALALCYPSPPSGWWRTFTSKLSNMLGTPSPALRA